MLTVIVQTEKGWAIVDAGWMALSRDRGTQNRAATGWNRSALDGTSKATRSATPARNTASLPASNGPLPDADIATRFPIGGNRRILPQPRLCCQGPSSRNTAVVWKTANAKPGRACGW